MTALRLRAGLALAATVAALATAGCGTSSVIDPVARAASVSTVSPGYRMTMSLTLSSPLLPAPITASGTGRFATAAPSGVFDLTLALPNVPQLRQLLGSGGYAIREVLTPTAVFIRLPPQLGGRAARAKPWLRLDLTRGGGAPPGLLGTFGGSFSSDPSQLLQYLRAVSGGVSTVGRETVAGRATTHYRATVDLNRVAAHAPAANRAAAERSVAGLESLTHLATLPVDVWIDADHLVRQLTMNAAVTAQGVPLTMALRVAFPHYGPEPPAAAPPASQVSDLRSLHVPTLTQTSTGSGTA